MTEVSPPPCDERSGFLAEARRILTGVAEPHNEGPATIRRRRILVALFVVVGFVLLGYSLRLPPGDPSFYWFTMALAAWWTLGAFVSGPVHLGRICFRGRNQRPVITGTAVGVILGAIFVVGGLVAREIEPVRDYIVQVLAYANQGSLAVIVAITVINGLAEELFFRGSLFTSLGKRNNGWFAFVVSTVIYVIVTGVSTQNPMLAFAAVILGTVCAMERRATGGVLAPMLTHFFWGLVMVLALPPIFGV
ncbi:abortive infection protein [Mycobacterium sp. 852013-51886_SCH5428379]|uniref:CPBP family intramembrane glutamic endopeptidase n=1 Tax=Mycobacterium sp. 852013-51886_SCH5428379 TaxID=1834111 RepID=UPI0007FDD03D|nr:CPBP family intramembrane glutamic endopeptidase [Mycobacterium sp. 852013-51886_SCH5428379]OBB57938.1 abortive infection protein [Mycobacterium sp. 852013-51886_SCH5428379]